MKVNNFLVLNNSPKGILNPGFSGMYLDFLCLVGLFIFMQNGK